jgi:hypothetical protein
MLSGCGPGTRPPREHEQQRPAPVLEPGLATSRACCPSRTLATQLCDCGPSTQTRRRHAQVFRVGAVFWVERQRAELVEPVAPGLRGAASRCARGASSTGTPLGRLCGGTASRCAHGAGSTGTLPGEMCAGVLCSASQCGPRGETRGHSARGHAACVDFVRLCRCLRLCAMFSLLVA